MKKSLFLLLALISSNTFAHGHWPQKIESRYLLTEAYQLKFNLSNHFEFKTCFDIELNKKILPDYKTCLAPKQNKNIAVWVSSGVDQKITNVVCSISRNKGSVSTKMCTTATTMYPASQLRGSSK